MKFGTTGDKKKGSARGRGMRGRYLVHSNRALISLSIVDGLLRILRREAAALPNEISTIVVANGAHLGDVLLTLPAIAALRNSYPRARIGAVVGSWARSVAEWSGLFDDVHVFDHWKHMRSTAGRFVHYRNARISTLRALRANGYQIGIDFYPFFPPTHPLFFQAGIPIRIGFESGGFASLLSHPVPWRNADIPLTEHLCDLLAILNPSLARRSVLEFRMPKPARVPSPLSPGNYLVLHPGAGARYKEWGTDEWHRLAASLRSRGETIVVTGVGAREKEISAHLLGVIDVSFVNKLSWQEFADVIGGAKAVICPDTVTGHLAAIFEVPTVVIFTGTNNVHHWAPRSPYSTTVVNPVHCAPCYRRGCETMACIRGVSVERVLSALDFVLESAGE